MLHSKCFPYRGNDSARILTFEQAQFFAGINVTLRFVARRRPSRKFVENHFVNSQFHGTKNGYIYIYIINFCCNLLSPSIIIVLSFRYLHKRRDVTHVLIGCRLERKLTNRNDWIRCSTPQMEVEFVTYELL